MFKKLPVDLSGFTFIDLGSGKGRALLFASNYGFKRIIGVEFSPELHQIAQSNIELFSKQTRSRNSFKLYCMDVEDFIFPEGDLVIYLYNPFCGKVMEAVIHKITQAINNNSSALYILYRNPQCAELFDNHPLLQKIDSSRSHNTYSR